jgi:copper homeostasis protein (lipoprotein)
MNKFKISTLMITIVILMSCNNKSTNSSTQEEQSKTQTKEQNNSLLSGIFSATLPCADCMGIQTSITFKKDGKIAKSTEYLDSDGTSLNEYGTWSKKDSIICVVIPNNPKEYYLLKQNNILVMLNTDKKEITGSLSENYIFKKNKAYTPEKLNGIYHTDVTGNGYNQILQLSAENDSIYNVKISFTGASKGCNFEGKGQLINNQIDIELNKINKELKGTMTILFKQEIAEIFTSKFEDRFSLNYFCGGGASLAGDYYKKK